METIEDIVREIRSLFPPRYFISRNYCVEIKQTVRTFADRIEAAYSELLKKIQQLEQENAHLRAALRPMLDIVMDSATSDLSMKLAITETKRIYNSSKEQTK